MINDLLYLRDLTMNGERPENRPKIRLLETTIK